MPGLSSLKDELAGKVLEYDYEHQAWTADGVYLDCNHPAAGTRTILGDIFEGCNCYGRAHKGERVCTHEGYGETERDVLHTINGDMVIGGHSDYYCNNCGARARSEY